MLIKTNFLRFALRMESHCESLKIYESVLCHGLWCTHVGQEEPKVVYTLFCCKPVYISVWILMSEGVVGGVSILLLT